MTAADLLGLLREAQVSLEVTPEGTLRYHAFERAITPGDLAAMKEHRDELIALLRAEANASDGAVTSDKDAAVVDLPEWRHGGYSGRLTARGWTMPGPLLWCVACNGGTVWADSAGRARHPWCAARGRRTA